MDYYAPPKWPQAGNNRLDLDFISLYSHSRPVPPKPLDPKYYERYAKVKAVQESFEKELEVAAAKVVKAEADLTVAEKAVAENKWSKAAAKVSNAQRLKNVLAEVKAAETLIRVKLDNYTKDNSPLIAIIQLQKSMEQTCQDYMNSYNAYKENLDKN